MCPVCNEPMVAYELEGIEIDRCATCGGTWLDAGELQQLAELAGKAPGALARVITAGKEGRRVRRRCPRGRHRLRELTVGDDTHVVLDRCPYGHGLWFDRGEMLTLIGATGEENAVTRFLAELYRNDTEEGA